MAITNFVPEVWSASLLTALRNQLVYAQAGVFNRQYEGDIARAGDTVHITSFDDPAVRSYTKNGDITWDLLNDTGQTLTIDQADYFAFKVDDIDKRQALPGFVDEATTGAAYSLATKADTYAATKLAAGVDSANKVGSVTVTAPEDAYNLLVELRTRLTKTNTPSTGRWVTVPPEFYAKLLKDDRFIRLDASGTTTGLRNGQVGDAAGFTVIEANTVPVGTGANAGVFTVLAGHSIAATWAEQIAETEALRLQNTFGDGIRGLHLYGAAVTRPKNIASAMVTVAA